MRLETTAGHLRSALSAFRGVVERRNTIPVLSMVKFADGRMCATNLDIELSLSLPTVGRHAGEAAIDYFALAGLAGHIPADDAVTIEDDSGMATLAFNGSSYRMAALPAGDFPHMNDAEGPTVHVGNLGLAAAMRRVAFAISTEETRYYLNGTAFVTDSDGQSYLAATTGHMLALVPIDDLPEGAAGKIMPRDLVRYLCRAASEPETLTFDATRPLCRIGMQGGTTILAKTIDGTFPDVFRVIPKDASPGLTVDRAHLIRVLRRMIAFASQKGRPVKLTAKAGALDLQMTEGVSGRLAQETMPAVETAAGGWEATFNADYLLRVLTCLEGETVTFSSDTEPASAPCIISGEGDPLILVLMPMRV